ncbi:MAG: biotin/lipoate A/B protein ligase family protein [Desulfuromonadaceae bacterium]|nr:biotin/lipoate A/B protein ligase family protein [Desulfuromonadaceae bacterium]MDD5104423.1 biotin/lipoate A/B protein ligase family protein [Desulfuromonadaceae bacterium]
MNAWRLLDTGTLPAALNMGIDMALLELHARGVSPPTLRFYQWNPPAISLGYFQRRHSIDLAACSEMGLDVVTRPTGGHAVLHENDLTYSVIAGAAEGIPVKLADAYKLLGDGLVKGFRLIGLETVRAGNNLTAPETDICFMRFAAGDILHNGKKFAGSALTLKGSSMLQHGSVVLDSQRDRWATVVNLKDRSHEEFNQHLASRTTSLGEISGQKVNPSELKAALVAGLAMSLNAEFQPGELTSDEWALAHDIAGNLD